MTSILIAVYVGGLLMGYVNLRGLNAATTLNMFYLLFWPVSAIIELVGVVSETSPTILGKISTVLTLGKTVFIWVKNLFVKSA
jgi:hypothetical protein